MHLESEKHALRRSFWCVQLRQQMWTCSLTVAFFNSHVMMCWVALSLFCCDHAGSWSWTISIFYHVYVYVQYSVEYRNQDQILPVKYINHNALCKFSGSSFKTLRALKFEVSPWVECQAYASIMLCLQMRNSQMLLWLMNFWSWEIRDQNENYHSEPTKKSEGDVRIASHYMQRWSLWAVGSKSPFMAMLPGVWFYATQPTFSINQTGNPLHPKNDQPILCQNIRRLDCNPTQRNLN